MHVCKLNINLSVMCFRQRSRHFSTTEEWVRDNMWLYLLMCRCAMLNHLTQFSLNYTIHHFIICNGTLYHTKDNTLRKEILPKFLFESQFRPYGHGNDNINKF